jgi:serine/threonine protein kinase
MIYIKIFIFYLKILQLKSNHYCYNKYQGRNIIKTYGFTKNPKLDDYILVMQYAPGGDLHKYLQYRFTTIDWKQKVSILKDISFGYLYFKYISK